MPSIWSPRDAHEELTRLLEHQEWLLHKTLDEVKQMSEQMNHLAAEVGEAKDVMTSAAILITGLAQQIRDTIGDPAAAEALANELDAKSNELAAVIVANTPPAPEPTPEPAPEPTPEPEPAPEG